MYVKETLIQKKSVFYKLFLLPSLNNDQINLCEKDLPETDLYNATKNMQNNKSLGLCLYLAICIFRFIILKKKIHTKRKQKKSVDIFVFT